MRFILAENAGDLARTRWQELVTRQSPVGALVAGLVTTATFAVLLAVVAKVSLLGWAISFPLCAMGIGVGMRRLSAAVTSRYGFAAGSAAALCGVLSLGFFSCGGVLADPRVWKISVDCFSGLLPNLALVAASFAVGALAAFFTAYRQVPVSELLPGKR